MRATLGAPTIISSNLLVYASPDAWKPIGVRQYRNLPHSVMKVVASLVFSDKGRLWYPFHASSTVFLVCGGIVETRLNRLGVWCVSLSVALFYSCRSTVHQGVPSFFAATTIRNHHTVGVPCGTGSMMPRRTSRSISAFTFFFQ